MEFDYISHQIVLFTHLIAFAFATSEIFRADWNFLNSTVLNVAELKSTARRVKWLLSTLWLTGLGLILMKFGFDFEALAQQPKILSKLVVVAVLTINGIAIHTVCIPLLEGRLRPFPFAAAAVAILGGVSTSTWIYAAFIGSARIVAPHWTFEVFMSLFCVALLMAVLIAITFVRPHVARVTSGIQRLALPAAAFRPKSDISASLSHVG